jgi:hypothetical protein
MGMGFDFWLKSFAQLTYNIVWRDIARNCANYRKYDSNPRCKK